MRAWEVYLKAAQMVESGEHVFPCTAVYSADPAHVSWNEPGSLTRRFILTMAPGRSGFENAWPASQHYLSRLSSGLKSHSVLALCFMAAMEDG